jgi:hypothetical protein
VAGCATKPRCAFVYDDHVRTAVVIPAVTAIDSGGAELFDLARPVVLFEHGHVTLLFDVHDAIHTLDPPRLIVELDPCSLKVISAVEADGTTVTRD